MESDEEKSANHVLAHFSSYYFKRANMKKSVVILCLMFCLPAYANQEKILVGQLSDKIANYLDKKASEDEFSGAVILTHKNKVVFSQGYGLANKQSKHKITVDTPINLGSMNKMFTGISVMQLVEQGRLNLQDKVIKYLPNYPNKKVRNRVTIHQLLTHTSGLGLYWNDKFENNKNNLKSTQDFADLFSTEPLRIKPGVRFHYSNNGPVVLGLIIEAITGMSYYQYVDKNIYQKSAMKHSGHFSKNEQQSNKATGYFLDSQGKMSISNLNNLGRIGSAAGGGYSSANDMINFASKLFDGSLLNSASRQLMLKGKIPLNEETSYSYLFADKTIHGQRFVGHNGSAKGISAAFSVFPELGYTMVVLSNYDQGAQSVAKKIQDWVARAK